MQPLSNVLIAHPELALFLALAIGYLIGKLRFRSFTLGSVTGCLIAGVLIGQTGVVISADVKQAFFLLFLFAIGYRTGPQFFQSLTADALPQIAVTVTFCVVALAIVLVSSVLFGLDVGTAAGLLAGGATESATVGVAIDTFQKTGAEEAVRRAFEANVATAFAVSYLVGVISAIVMLSQVAPRLLRRPLAEACAELESKLNAPSDGQTTGQSARRAVEARAFRINERWVGMTVADAERKIPPDVKAFVGQVRRGDEIIMATPNLKLEEGDVVSIAGLRGYIVQHAKDIGEEVDDKDLLDVPVDIADIVVSRREIAGKTIFELNRLPAARTVFLRRFSRSGGEMPVYGGLKVERGDVLTMVGTPKHIADAAAVLGYVDRPTTETDMVYVGVFIFLGGLMGIPALRLGALELGLGVAVGTLVGGLIAGWLRSRVRYFGFVPAATLWLFDSLGLSAFIACVGISAGPRFLVGLIESGPALVLVPIVVVVLSYGAAVLVGSRIFKMNEGVLLGTCAGAGTSAPALAAIQDVAKSQVPTLGYGLGYAIGNMLLALWGAIIVTALG